MITVCRNTFPNLLGIKRYEGARSSNKTFSYRRADWKSEQSDHESNRNIDRKRRVQIISRVYLSAELNFKKMFRMNRTPREIFGIVFNTWYNIGFGSPRADVRSECSEFLERCERESNEEEQMLEK